jgi:hypothetical protein
MAIRRTAKSIRRSRTLRRTKMARGGAGSKGSKGQGSKGSKVSKGSKGSKGPTVSKPVKKTKAKPRVMPTKGKGTKPKPVGMAWSEAREGQYVPTLTAKRDDSNSAMHRDMLRIYSLLNKSISMNNTIKQELDQLRKSSAYLR